MARSVGWFLLVLVASACYGSRYTHTLLNVNDYEIVHYGPGFINDCGQALYSYSNKAGGSALYINSTRVTDQYTYLNPRGINNHGDFVWEWAGYDPIHQIDASHVMLDNYALSDNTGGHTWVSAEAAGINQSGQVAWGASWDYGGGDPAFFTFVGDTNYSALYGAYSGGPAALNNRGQLLWQHYAPPDGHLGLFLDGEEVDGGMGAWVWGNNILRRPLNDRGSYLWAYKPSSAKNDHVFLNQTDLTLAVLGRDVESTPIAVNQNDQVLWEYDWDLLHHHTMLDGVDLTAEVPGAPDGAGIAVNDRGDVLWITASPAGSAATVRVNEFDLTADLLGNQAYDAAFALDINNSGQVLWYVARNGQTFWYLSTPVPEPSVLLVGLPLVAALARRRKSAG